MIIGRDSQTDTLRRQQLESGDLVRSNGGFRPGGAGGAAPQGLRAAPQMSMSSLPEMSTFDKWALQDAVSKPVAGARGITASQRQMAYDMARDPIKDALKVGEMNLDAQTKFAGGLLAGQNQIGYANALGQNQLAAQGMKDMNALDEFDPLARNTGGRVPKGLRKGVDKIPAMLTEGEYVLPVDTVEQLGGPEKLDNLVRSTNGQEPGGVPVQKQGLRGYAAGGQVDNYTNSVARQEWLRRIAAQGNQMPAAQAELQRGNRNAFAAAESQSMRPMQPTQQFAAADKASVEGYVPPAPARAPAPLTDEDKIRRISPYFRSSGEPAPKTLADLIPSKEAVQNYFAGLNERVTGLPSATTTPAQQFAAADKASMQGYTPPSQVATPPAQQPAPAAQEEGSGEEVMARHEAADKVRGQWQAMSPNGLRGANQGAVDLYNKEQTIRGTGVRALSNNSFDNFGQPAKPQYVGADGKATNDWKNTSGYRDKMMEYASSSSPDLRRKGLMGLRDLAARQNTFKPTGIAELDALRQAMGDKEGAELYGKMIDGKGKGPEGLSLSDQIKLGEQLGVPNLLPRMEQDRVRLAQNQINQGDVKGAMTTMTGKPTQGDMKLAADNLKVLEAASQEGFIPRVVSNMGEGGMLGGLAAGGLRLAKGLFDLRRGNIAGLRDLAVPLAQWGGTGALVGGGAGLAEGVANATHGITPDMAPSIISEMQFNPETQAFVHPSIKGMAIPLSALENPTLLSRLPFFKGADPALIEILKQRTGKYQGEAQQK